MKNLSIFNRVFQLPIIAGKKYTLAAWDYDERLWKKIHFLSKPILEKHGIEPKEMKAPWPHISAALIQEPVTKDEREKLKLAAPIVKPVFKFKQLAMFEGQKDYGVDYLSVEFDVPEQFLKFLKFAEDVCGVDRVMHHAEHRPHVSVWAIKKEQKEAAEKALPEIKEAVKRYLQPFKPTKLSIWDNFEISEIESIGCVLRNASFSEKVKRKYVAAESYPYYRVSDNAKGNKATEDNSRADPYGVYLFIKDNEPDVSGMWDEMKYTFDAAVKPGVKLLDLSKISKPLAKKLLKNAGLQSFTDVWKLKDLDAKYWSYDRSEEEVEYAFPNIDRKSSPSEEDLDKGYNCKNTYRIIRLVYKINLKTNKKFTDVFRREGYGGIIDVDGHIYPTEPQVIIFNPDDVIWGKCTKLTNVD